MSQYKENYHIYCGWATDKRVFSKLNFPQACFYHFNDQELRRLDNPIIIGYSLGCLQALKQSLFSLPKALILFAPFLYFCQEKQKIRQVKAMKLALRKDKIALLTNFYHQALSPAKGSFPLFYKGKEKDLQKGLENLLKQDMRKVNFSSLSCPTLIIQGKFDKINPQKSAQKVSEKIAQSQLFLIKCGHLALWTNPKECQKIINQFLNKNDLL